jgi:hypothetical protein
MKHAVALAAAALVWRGSPVQEVYAKTKVAPIEVTKQNTNHRYVPAAGAVLLATGTGTVLGKKFKTSKREKKESTSSDDEHRLRAAKRAVENMLEGIVKSVKKRSPPKSYLDNLSTNTQERHKGIESYADHLSSVAKETPPSAGLIRSASEKVTKIAPPVAEVKSPTEPAVDNKTREIPETKITPTPLALPVTQSTTMVTAPIVKEPANAPKAQDSDNSAPEMPVMEVPPKPLVLPVTQFKAVVTTQIAQEPDNVPKAEETISGRVQNTFSTFSPKKLLKETKHIIEAPRKKVLLRKYAAIEDESEKAFTILLDLGMVELHPDPGSPGYDSSMDNQFVE